MAAPRAPFDMMRANIIDNRSNQYFSVTTGIRRLWAFVPVGGTLPEEIWSQRHRFLLGLTWLHAVIIACLGPLLGYSWEFGVAAFFDEGTVLHAIGEASIVAFFAAMATWLRIRRKLQATLVGLGLMSSSAILVHLSGGLIELHFHFFVMLAFLALYQDWLPYVLAIVYVAIHHGFVGVVWPQEVYNHTAALNAPWTWGVIHAFFVLWAAVGSAIAWRFNEKAFAQTKLILDSVGEGIFGLDGRGKVTFINPTAASLLGCKADEVVGKAIHRILRHARPDGSVFSDDAAPILACLRHGKSLQATDELFSRADGTCFPVDYACTPIFERAELTGVVVTFSDVSRRKQRDLALQESEERFRQIAENIKEVFWVTDPVKNERLYVSPAYQEVWGRAPSSVGSLSQSWLGFIHPEDLGRVLAAVMMKQVMGQYDEEYRIVRPDGSIRWLRDRAFPVKNDSGKVYRIIGIAEDITKSKRAEEELESRYTELAILHDVSQTTLRSTDLKAVLEKILDRALSAVSLEVGNIRLFESNGVMRIGAYRGYRDPENIRAHHPDVRGLESGILTRRVIASGKSLVVDDITTTEGLRTFKKEGVCFAVVVPITTQEETLGVIEAGSRVARNFRPDDVRLLEAIGNQVGIAAQKARLLEETERRAQEQEALNIIAKATSQSLHRDELLEIALDKILEVTGRERVSIRLKDPVTGQVALAAHRGFSREDLEELLRVTSHAITEKVFATGQPQVINSSEEGRNGQVWLPQSRSIAWIPIKAGTKVVGILGVSAGESMPFAFREIELLQAIGNMLGVALENARLFGETQARYRELQTLQVVSSTILDSLDLKVMMERILHQSCEIGNFDIGVIRLLNPTSGCLEPVASCGYRERNNVQSHRQKLEGYIAGAGSARVLEDKAVHVVDLTQIDGMRTFKREGICSLVAVPLRSHEDVLGVIQLGTRTRREFSESELRILETIGGQAGIAVQKARLYDEIKGAQSALAEKAEELAKSNTELQHFAYIASHDLQEPLRMVASYVQLLARRYKGKLDGDANEFIAFAVDGAARMQALINALLAYSRIGTKGKPFEPSHCEKIFESALKNLKVAIEESRARVTHDALPTVMGDDIQLTQLFQNLIGNAIKFRGNKPPSVHVSAERNGNEWFFSFRDDGIGIDPQYSERIFVIFQRLHSKEEYPGTGIGLALCKKIVERHGGRIWVESEPGNGATFRFSLPCETFYLEGEKNCEHASRVDE
jgi:PAS domain S-box-containing protein